MDFTLTLPSPLAYPCHTLGIPKRAVRVCEGYAYTMRRVCEGYASLYFQTILIQQEVHQSHHQNALFIAPGFDVVFYNDNLLERVIYINQ